MIEVITNAEVVGCEGQAGDFRVRVRKNPRFVHEDICVACGLCVEVCPAGAAELVEVRGRRQAEINPALCKGCGLCVAGCRGGAITLHGFTDQQLLGQLAALLRPAELVSV